MFEIKLTILINYCKAKSWFKCVFVTLNHLVRLIGKNQHLPEVCARSSSYEVAIYLAVACAGCRYRTAFPKSIISQNSRLLWRGVQNYSLSFIT